jgi:hypothetical protein
MREWGNVRMGSNAQMRWGECVNNVCFKTLFILVLDKKFPVFNTELYIYRNNVFYGFILSRAGFHISGYKCLLFLFYPKYRLIEASNFYSLTKNRQNYPFLILYNP